NTYRVPVPAWPTQTNPADLVHQTHVEESPNYASRQQNRSQIENESQTDQVQDQVVGSKPKAKSKSQYGVAPPGLTVNADKYHSLTDEKMLKIVHELVIVGIAQTEVGKAAEVCYLDLIKAKVLFALPGHMTKSYACSMSPTVPWLLDKVPLSMAHKVNVELPFIVPDFPLLNKCTL
ncbi:hypothetical protein Tco_0818856, partial [Tanacetum coccineum]